MSLPNCCKYLCSDEVSTTRRSGYNPRTCHCTVFHSRPPLPTDGEASSVKFAHNPSAAEAEIDTVTWRGYNAGLMVSVLETAYE